MTTNNDRAILAAYLPQREVHFMFCNERAALTFVDTWNAQHIWTVEAAGPTVRLKLANPQGWIVREFNAATEWFNAAAQHAAKIIKGESNE